MIFCWDYPEKLLVDKSGAFYCTFEFDLTDLFKCYFETDLVFGLNQIYWKELNIFIWPKPLLKQQVMVNTTKEKKCFQFFPYFGERSISLSRVHGITTRGQSKPQSKTDTQDRQYVERGYTKRVQGLYLSYLSLDWLLLTTPWSCQQKPIQTRRADLFSPYASKRLLSCS